MVPEKNVTEIFCDADDDDHEDARSDPYMSPTLKRAGNTKIIQSEFGANKEIYKFLIITTKSHVILCSGLLGVTLTNCLNSIINFGQIFLVA